MKNFFFFFFHFLLAEMGRRNRMLNVWDLMWMVSVECCWLQAEIFGKVRGCIMTTMDMNKSIQLIILFEGICISFWMSSKEIVFPLFPFLLEDLKERNESFFHKKNSWYFRKSVHNFPFGLKKFSLSCEREIDVLVFALLFLLWSFEGKKENYVNPIHGIFLFLIFHVNHSLLCFIVFLTLAL